MGVNENLQRAIDEVGVEPINPFGTCFDSVAAHVIEGIKYADREPTGIRIIHAICISNMYGEEGETMGHAWIEFDHHDGRTRVAADTTWGIAQKAEYYREQLKPKYIVEYTELQFLRLLCQTNSCGPFDEKIKEITDQYVRRSSED